MSAIQDPYEGLLYLPKIAAADGLGWKDLFDKELLHMILEILLR